MATLTGNDAVHCPALHYSAALLYVLDVNSPQAGPVPIDGQRRILPHPEPASPLRVIRRVCRSLCDVLHHAAPLPPGTRQLSLGGAAHLYTVGAHVHISGETGVDGGDVVAEVQCSAACAEGRRGGGGGEKGEK